MGSSFLAPVHNSASAPDIYADKSALVLQWLLLKGIERESFSLREAASDSGVSLGLVSRVFEHLVKEGYVATVGARTAKKFKLRKAKQLLTAWSEHYSLTKKCKLWNYQTALGSREEVLNVLKRSKLWGHVSLALHSAAEFHRVKNTNLQTIEFYLLDPEIRPQLEQKLELHPQERGYEVLLIKPYYKALLNSGRSDKFANRRESKASSGHLFYAPSLLTYLDLYNFPLRGREQAEFMAQRIAELKRIVKVDSRA